jgi:hypothetical protein
VQRIIRSISAFGAAVSRPSRPGLPTQTDRHLDLAGRLVTPGLVEIPTQSVQLFTTKRQKG